MSQTSSPLTRRIWSDPFFYIVLSVIGGAYVLLILAMLFADSTYIFTSDMTRPVTLDFATYEDRSKTPVESVSFRTGDVLTDQYPQYGLTVSSGDGSNPIVVIDSDVVSASNSDLGTPNIEFGGPGIGIGGHDELEGQPNSGRNDMPMGNVLVVASSGPPYEIPNEREAVVDWAEPVNVVSILISGLESHSGTIGMVTAIDRHGKQVAVHSILKDGNADELEVVFDESKFSRGDIARLIVSLPKSAREIDVDYVAPASAKATLTGTRAKTLRHGHIHVVPSNTPSVAPQKEGGKMTFQWADPIRLDRVQVLNIDEPGGTLTTYDVKGQVISVTELENRGENSVQTIEYSTENPNREVPDPGESGVARLEVNLPCGGAVSEIDFTWTGRVRAAWERNNPGLARLFYNPITAALGKPEIQYSIKLSLISCTITAILSLWVAIPIGYLLARHTFWGRNFVDAVLDIPIVLPPLVVGISLLILFQFIPDSLAFIREGVVYQVPAVIIAQFAVACAFAVRTMRATFDQIDARREQVALTLGCSRAQAFGMVVLPEAWRGILTAGTLAWARSLGEFGPLLIFAGATRNKTEVLSTTVYLELSIGDLGAAVAVSLIMVVAAVVVLVVARLWGTRSLSV